MNRVLVLLSSWIIVVIAEPLFAADQYWDVNGATTGLGGTGTWNTTTANWNDSTGTSTPAVWTGNNNAIFEATAGTVTVNTAAVLNVGGLQFNVNGYTLTGANTAAGTLTMDPGAVIALGTNTVNLNALLSGGATTKTGTGTLSLGGGTVNSNGPMTINAGLVELSKSGGAIAMNSGAIIGTGTGAANAAVVRIIGPGGNQIGNGGPMTVRIDGKFDFNGASELTGALTLHGTATQSATVTTTAASTGVMQVNGALTFNGGGAMDSGTSTGKITLIPNNGLFYAALAGNNGSMGTISGIFETNGIHTFTIGNDTSLPVDMRIAAVVQGTAISLTKAASGGTLELAAANTFAAPFVVNPGGGTLLVSSNDALGTTAGATTVNINSTLAFGGGINYSTAESVTINGTGDTANTRAGAIDNLSGSNTFAGAVTLASNSTIGSSPGVLTLTGGINGHAASRALTFNGAGNLTVDTVGIGSNISTLTKNGAGTVTLGAVTHNYTGATAVNSGALILNGSVTSNATVNSGGTLGGSGSIAGSVTVNSGGALAPGNSPGTLDVTSLVLNAGSTTLIELGGPTPGDGTGFYDQINVAGAATVGGSLIVSRFAGYPLTRVDDIFYILTRASGSGTFAGLPEGSTVGFTNGGFGKITYQANWTGSVATSTLTGGDDVALFAVVPEPGSAASLIAVSSSLLLRRRPRRRRQTMVIEVSL